MPLNPLTLSSNKPTDPVLSSQEPTVLTDQEFTGQINNFLEEGIRNDHSQDYVAGQIYELAQEHPGPAINHRLTDYPAIKAGVDFACKFEGDFEQGNRPVAMQDTTGFDLFMMGVEADLRRQERDRPLSEAERRDLEESGRVIKRDMMILAGVTTAVVGGVALAPVVVRAGQWLTGVAATPRGQEVLKNATECIGALVEGTPPPSTPVASECYLADKVIDKAREIADRIKK